MPRLRTVSLAEVELDQHNRLVAHYPAVVTGFDRNDLRCSILQHAAVGQFRVDLATRQKTDMGVDAQVSAYMRLHGLRPAEAGRVDQALDPAVACLHHIEFDDFAVLGALLRRGRWLPWRRASFLVGAAWRVVSLALARIGATLLDPCFDLVFRRAGLVQVFAQLRLLHCSRSAPYHMLAKIDSNHYEFFRFRIFHFDYAVSYRH